MAKRSPERTKAIAEASERISRALEPLTAKERSFVLTTITAQTMAANMVGNMIAEHLSGGADDDDEQE